MKQDLIIRRATIEDYEEISHVGVICWKNTYTGIFPQDFLDKLTPEAQLKKRLSYFSAANKFSIIALLKGKIVGFCDYGDSRLPRCASGEVYSLYILPEYKRHGIGRDLIYKAIKNLSLINFNSCIVTTLAVNLSAQKFYKKVGFKEVEQITSKIGDHLYKEIVYLYGEKHVK